MPRVKGMMAALVAMALILTGACGSLAWPSSSGAAALPEGRASQEAYEAYVAPEKSAGGYGWTLGYATAAHRGGRGYSLNPDASSLILFRSILSRRLLARPVSGFLLTTGQVAAVSVDGGPPIPTRSEAGVPYGWRVLLYEIPGVTNGELRRRSGKFTLFDASGQVIVAPPTPEMEPAAPDLTADVWRGSSRRTAGVCQITADRFPGLTPLSVAVLSRFTSPTGLVGGTFLSCASNEYDLHGKALEAAVLLDGAHPGSTPAALPGLEPVPGQRGVLQSRAAAEELVGRRIAGAWLIVEGGSDLQQRLAVLAHLRASVHL